MWVQSFRGVAIVALALIPAAEITLPLWLLIVLGASIFVSEYFSSRIVKSRSARLQKIQDRTLRVIADLASGTGERYDLWVIDVYLPDRRWFSEKGLRKQLTRAVSLTLTDVQNVPPEIELTDNGPLARCYKTREHIFWCDPHLNPDPASQDACSSEEDNEKLSGTYGVASVNAIVNNTGHDCRGILVIHTKPDPELVTSAFGILTSPRGRRHILAACHDIHGHLI